MIGNVIRHRTANALERGVAALLNLPFGSLPAAVPAILYDYRPFGVTWARSENILDAIAFSLALLQAILVYKMQGSPGAVLVGLRVESPDGGRPTRKAVAGRAVPYFLALILKRLVWRAGDAGDLIAVVAGSSLLVGILVFVAASGLEALRRGPSLLDRLTHTVVVKAYKVRPAATLP